MHFTLSAPRGDVSRLRMSEGICGSRHLQAAVVFGSIITRFVASIHRRPQRHQPQLLCGGA